MEKLELAKQLLALAVLFINSAMGSGVDQETKLRAITFGGQAIQVASKILNESVATTTVIADTSTIPIYNPPPLVLPQVIYVPVQPIQPAQPTQPVIPPASNPEPLGAATSTKVKMNVIDSTGYRMNICITSRMFDVWFGRGQGKQYTIEVSINGQTMKSGATGIAQMGFQNLAPSTDYPLTVRIDNGTQYTVMGGVVKTPPEDKDFCHDNISGTYEE